MKSNFWQAVSAENTFGYVRHNFKHHFHYVVFICSNLEENVLPQSGFEHRTSGLPCRRATIWVTEVAWSITHLIIMLGLKPFDSDISVKLSSILLFISLVQYVSLSLPFVPFSLQQRQPPLLITSPFFLPSHSSPCFHTYVDINNTNCLLRVTLWICPDSADHSPCPLSVQCCANWSMLFTS